jgi:TolA-binding protein
MKKLVIVIFVLGFVIQACTLTGQSPRASTKTFDPSTVASITPRPPATSTNIPTLVPTFTPTPVPEVRVASGDHALFNGDYDTALSEYTAALAGSADPAIQSAAILGEGRIYFLGGDYPHSLNAFRTVTDNYPGSSLAGDAYYFLGETYMQLDR